MPGLAVATTYQHFAVQAKHARGSVFLQVKKKKNEIKEERELEGNGKNNDADRSRQQI